MSEFDPNLVRSINQLPEQVRLVDDDGSTVVTKSAAWNLKTQEGLDLYLLNKNASPPVYKLLDYGKYRFDKQKKDREQKKKLRDAARPLKEFKFKPMIDEHDVEVKLHHIRENLAEHDIKICVDLKGKGGARQNWVVLTNRGTRPIYHAVNEEDFVLNRVLETIKDLVLPTRLNITENQIYAILRPARVLAETLNTEETVSVEVLDR